MKLTKSAFIDCIVQPEVQGSDHCPVKGTLKWELIPAKKCPPLCTKYLPEFAGKQQKLLSYFKKRTKDSACGPTMCVEVGKNSSSPQSGHSNSNSQSPSHFKRQSSSPSTNATKKLKKTDKQGSGGKQTSLINFFTSKATKQAPKEDGDKSVQESSTELGNHKNTGEKIETSNMSNNNASESKAAKIQTAASSWKNLLKGPDPPPLCKGHKEPMVLRTVKKDSLNKGRQFYVCNRPEGHKSNPEARCDHFEWKKK